MLATQGNAVGATRNDVTYDQSLLTWNGCTINPLIGPSSATNKQATSTALGAGVQRVDVSGATQSAIGDAALYACALTINPAAPLGTLTLGNTPTAFTPAGNQITGTSGSAGQVVVTTCPTDCNGDGTASVGELVLCINKYLGEPLCNPTTPAGNCPVADANNDGHVSLGEISACASRYINGC